MAGRHYRQYGKSGAGENRCEGGSWPYPDRWLLCHRRAGVYAMGDAGQPALAGAQSRPWKFTISVLRRLPRLRGVHPIADNSVPGCTYCRPQIASVGLVGKPQAGRLQTRVGRFPFMVMAKAIAMGEDQGLIKTVFDADTGALQARI